MEELDGQSFFCSVDRITEVWRLIKMLKFPVRLDGKQLDWEKHGQRNTWMKIHVFCYKLDWPGFVWIIGSELLTTWSNFRLFIKLNVFKSSVWADRNLCLLIGDCETQCLRSQSKMSLHRVFADESWIQKIRCRHFILYIFWHPNKTTSIPIF